MNHITCTKPCCLTHGAFFLCGDSSDESLVKESASGTWGWTKGVNKLQLKHLRSEHLRTKDFLKNQDLNVAQAWRKTTCTFLHVIWICSFKWFLLSVLTFQGNPTWMQGSRTHSISPSQAPFNPKTAMPENGQPLLSDGVQEKRHGVFRGHEA